MPRQTRYCVLTFDPTEPTDPPSVYDAGTRRSDAETAVELVTGYGLDGRVLELHPLIECPGTARPEDVEG